MRRRANQAVRLTRTIGRQFSRLSSSLDNRPGLRVSVASAGQLGNVTVADGNGFAR